MFEAATRPLTVVMIFARTYPTDSVKNSMATVEKPSSAIVAFRLATTSAFAFLL